MPCLQKWYALLITLAAFLAPGCSSPQPAKTGMSAAGEKGPLRVSTKNPRYFTDNSGKAIYLTGTHTWANLQDITEEASQTAFDYEKYLDFLERYNHNFFRLWTWENSFKSCWAHDTLRVIYGVPNVYPRTGPRLANDSLPKFDLRQFNQAYFTRLRCRVEAAGKRDMYVMIMLFQGFSVEKKGNYKNDPTRGNPWVYHPLNRENNINGIDGDLNRDGEGQEIETLQDTSVTALQKEYIRKVIDTVNDLNNVLYEICNESDSTSYDWQYEMINFIHSYEKTLPRQHPVVMTVPWPGGKNSKLFASPAEAISPNIDGADYRNNPPAGDGSKVIITDTDHLWGIGGNRYWVWKSFLRGLNPLFMDPYAELIGDYTERNSPDYPEWKAIRENMGYTRRFAQRMNLIDMVPRNDLASSGYCLANPTAEKAEYLVYLPEGGEVKVDLTASSGELLVKWFNPETGATTDIWKISGGTVQTFSSPIKGHAVCYIHRD